MLARAHRLWHGGGAQSWCEDRANCRRGPPEGGCGMDSQPSGKSADSTSMNIIGAIPARYASTRFPGKPLALINGKPLIQHVVEGCQKAAALREIIVATDDTRIWEAVQDFCRVEMTSPEHPSGTDRIAEVVERTACDAAIN